MTTTALPHFLPFRNTISKLPYKYSNSTWQFVYKTSLIEKVSSVTNQKMKRIFTIILLTVLVNSCSNKTKQYPIEGKWRYMNKNKGCEIILKKGTYNYTRWNDDVINCSNGKYFVNENTGRKCTTLTLVPDIQISEGDSLIIGCINIDVVSRTDSTFLAREPSPLHRGINLGTKWEDHTKLFKKE